MRPLTQQLLMKSLFSIKDHKVQALFPQHAEVLGNVKECVETGDLKCHTGDTSAPTQQQWVLQNPAEQCWKYLHILFFLENNSTHIPSMAPVSPLLENLLHNLPQAVTQVSSRDRNAAAMVYVPLFHNKISLLNLLRSRVLYLCTEHFNHKTILLLYNLW